MPRRYESVKVEQSRLTTISLDAPGIFKSNSYKPVTGQIFEIVGNNEFEWVCDLNDKTTSNEFILLPGKYKLVYRQMDLKETNYTRTREFNIYSNQTVTLNL